MLKETYLYRVFKVVLPVYNKCNKTKKASVTNLEKLCTAKNNK